mmetsp:Transcript_27190/g.62740  ORF Transcript_27190/g.62740 Transcript_27190/m.62740 type:complete len:166 (-) Transcript_27190:29-526(-)
MWRAQLYCMIHVAAAVVESSFMEASHATVQQGTMPEVSGHFAQRQGRVGPRAGTNLSNANNTVGTAHEHAFSARLTYYSSICLLLFGLASASAACAVATHNWLSAPTGLTPSRKAGHQTPHFEAREGMRQRATTAFSEQSLYSRSYNPSELEMCAKGSLAATTSQ